jgi:hypothetical protein
MSNYIYRRFINRCLINWSFYKGQDGQWIFDEDIEAFFLDESGDVRNRLKWTKNVIKPMVQQYVGNAIRLSYDAKAKCISDFVINKREEELGRLKSLQKVADALPFFKDIIKEDTSAFICEFMQSCGGQVIPPKDFYKALYKNLKAKGIVCIGD